MLAAGLLAAVAPARAAAPVHFGSFTYTGLDAVFEGPLPGDAYRNPVLAGFYPDPDVCRVGGDFYLVNSSFAYFPGIPVFHSTDLVNWTQIGNAVDRPTQLNYDGLGVSRGIFAPALSHHGDTFYLICTFVGAGGNFLMTAKKPAGPWSDPVWLGFDGIDPSLFFDADGRAWLVNNGGPPDNKPLYNGHRAIYLREFDPVAKKVIGAGEIIVNGGTDLEKHPVWIEGPHLFTRDGWYYLICAEGGTAEDHSEVVFRSRSVHGPFVPGPLNPILTQRTLDASRPHPVTCTGHADFVQAGDGYWWSVFLGCRPYAANDFNTGRETFMLPVSWKDGWPSILPEGDAVPYVVRGPAGAGLKPAAPAFTGNGTTRYDFSGGDTLPRELIMLRRPSQAWWSMDPVGHLSIQPQREPLSGKGNPSFIGHRLQHARFESTVDLLPPSHTGVSAGLALFQNEKHYYFVGVRWALAGRLDVFVEDKEGAPLRALVNFRDRSEPVELRIAGDGAIVRFYYHTGGDSWAPLGGDFDATVLSTRAAGGFVGSVVGPFARIDPQ